MARIDNGWRWYVRLAQPQTRLAAITSRPMRLHGVARLTQHAGQSWLLLTLAQAAGARIKERMAHIRAGLKQVLATAPPWPTLDRWRALVRYIVNHIIAARLQNPSQFSLSAPRLAIGSV
ncbi:MAG: hypothetical protein KA204_10245 [Chromatiaceae bacterium]|nr:hypothetical protein [Chromatiaceae bacterium]MBP6733984.1 hypothetical protein [Chromatiaceae bacterium]MBP6807604.1 hypothetical protein [Chromatiaceae bacterium]MBP8289558.1 hypothetical protein [Chromatiaceae bacterium]